MNIPARSLFEISRRTFVGAGIAAALALRSPDAATAAVEPKRLSYLSLSPIAADTKTLLEAALDAFGWTVGRNILVDYRSAEGQYDRLLRLVADVVRAKPHVLLAGQTPTAQALGKATDEIPIVMVGIGDPVRYGVVRSATRPERNITGVSYRVNEVGVKLLEILKEAVPKVREVAMFVNPDNPGAVPLVEAARLAAPALGLTIREVPVSDATGLDRALEGVPRQRPDALWLAPEGFVIANRQRIIDVGLAHRVPAVGPSVAFTRAGALLSYAPHWPSILKDTARYVDRLLRGARVADLPLEDPSRFELILNARTAKALGLTIPPALLARADQVIE